ncbi:DNA replication protein DnaC [Andreprevotia lacus DSM 23236]|jgi:DNA replication protein DnaC|uniref:DNA replication protein DnaC n=1 Tax=Andreprevotia lacus DSM 23236 TaxID=1121001 RepID=A0A1W1XP70_9NEIS|nr:IS21-like element helper ATPase IstB [Andreprevotia lacus]SMC25652.1 DNA replication protein DnaC [Andreprevotia lacus DSM 23236]
MLTPTTIPQKLADLGLAGMAAALLRQQADPTMTIMPFEQRLGLLLDEELNSRDNRRINRLMKQAKLRYNQAALEDVDYRSGRGLDRLQIQTLAGGEWMRQRQNLILTGPTGTGKSWLACAFGQQACRQGLLTYYTTATRLFEDLANSLLDGTLPKRRRQLARLPLLIIDDLGIGGIDPRLGPILLEILDQQSMEGALIITSQYPPEKWYDLFGDPTVADAILDRIVHRAHLMALKGESMRKLRGKKTG